MDRSIPQAGETESFDSLEICSSAQTDIDLCRSRRSEPCKGILRALESFASQRPVGMLGLLGDIIAQL
jgi:hypothetical protein